MSVKPQPPLFSVSKGIKLSERTLQIAKALIAFRGRSTFMPFRLRQKGVVMLKQK